MKVTVREVAAAANVSVGTVSRVLNGDRTVRLENIERVLEAASSMNYRPLRQRKSAPPRRPLEGKKVGVVLLGMDQALATLPVVATAIQGVEAALSQAGASLLFANCPRLEISANLMRERIDGLILKGALQGSLFSATSGELLARLRGIPATWILGRPEGFWGDSVGANDWRVGELAARTLWVRGHRRFGFLNPKADHQSFCVRQQSFLHTARRRGAAVHCALGTAGDPARWPLPPVRDASDVAPLVDELLAVEPRPTAWFVPADNIAALVYRELAVRGLRVGQDVSLISCNGERSLTATLYPALTTIDIHAEQIGLCAVEQLAQRMAERSPEPSIDVQLEPHLIAGDSIADLPVDETKT